MTSKLVFVGDMGAGKTTAIAAISDHPPVSTDMPITDAQALDPLTGKTHTTVALDYSSIDLGGDSLLHVYGVPGQASLDFMWPIVATGAVGWWCWSMHSTHVRWTARSTCWGGSASWRRRQALLSD